MRGVKSNNLLVFPLKLTRKPNVLTIDVLTISGKTEVRDGHQILLLLLNNLFKLTSISP